MFASSPSEEALQMGIHSIRQVISNARQPRHRSGMDRLQQHLATFGISHPYGLNDEQFESLLEMEIAFRAGGIGLPATIPGQDFIYRLSGVTKVKKYVELWRDRYEAHTQDDELFGVIYDQFIKRGDWLPLSDYASGLYRSPREISWWTSLELPTNDPKTLLSKVSQCGIPSNWISKWSLVLRCRLQLDRGNSARVPTALDGFDSEIFHPTIDEHTPAAGVAIHLDTLGRVRSGTNEFVLQPIPVDHVEVWPVLIGDEAKKTAGIPLNFVLRKSLVNYYTGLQE